MYRAAARDAGGVHDAVDAPMPCGDVVEEAGDRFLVGDVHLLTAGRPVDENH